MKTNRTKETLTAQLCEYVAEVAECECDTGSNCALCLALILADMHSEWEIKDGVLQTKKSYKVGE